MDEKPLEGMKEHHCSISAHSTALRTGQRGEMCEPDKEKRKGKERGGRKWKEKPWCHWNTKAISCGMGGAYNTAPGGAYEWRWGAW